MNLFLKGLILLVVFYILYRTFISTRESMVNNKKKITGLEGFGIVDRESILTRGKQSNSIPINKNSHSSDSNHNDYNKKGILFLIKKYMNS